jgi:CRISPR/Cas system-associated exonuclease Cas4 (RecB family)
VRKFFNHKSLVLPELMAVTEEGVGRIYLTPSGEKYPSVTTVLGLLSKDSIAEWRKRVGDEEANRISKKATSLGTDIHKIVEDYLNNKEDYIEKYGPFEKMVFSSFQECLNKIDNILCQESTLYSDVLKVAGRVDCIAEYEGQLSIIDFKTANKAKEEEHILGYFMQLTMYSLMLEEMTGICIPNIVILMVTTSAEVLVFKKKRKDYYKQVKDLINEYRRTV